VSTVVTEAWTVDGVGYGQVSGASRCAAVSRSIQAFASQKTPLDTPRDHKGRSSPMLLKNHVLSGQAGETLYIGGEEANLSTSYPLGTSESIVLPLTAKVLSNFIGVGSQGSEVRKLELT